jgi:hypothetical protein
MATPRDLAERSAPLLPPGSQVRQAFICQTAPNFAFFFINWISGLTMFLIRYRCVAITQDAMYVLEGSKQIGRRPAQVDRGHVAAAHSAWASVGSMGSAIPAR